MTDIEKQVMNRVSANADLEGAQDLVDAHLDDVTAGMLGRGFSLHINWNPPSQRRINSGPLRQPKDDALSPILEEEGRIVLGWRPREDSSCSPHRFKI